MIFIVLDYDTVDMTSSYYLYFTLDSVRLKFLFLTNFLLSA